MTAQPGVGVVVPYDFAQDREMWRWVPAPLSLHVTRTPYVAVPADAGQARMISAPEIVRQAVQNVLLPEPGVVAYSCTSGSFVGGADGERALREVLLDAGAPRAVTTAGSLAAALDVERIALATPYVEDLTDRLVGFLAAHGVHTVRRHGLGLLGRIWDVTPDEVVDAIRVADHADAEAVFVSCTNLPTYDAIADLERELGKPVLTANQVTMWAALGAVGVDAVGPGQALIEAGSARARRTPEAGPDSPAEPPGVPGLPELPDDGVAAVTLHRVRVRLPDQAGALARLTAAVAETGGNILALSVHGADSRSVVDEMLVGGVVSAQRLERVIRRRLRCTDPDPDPDAVGVVPADPHELVDVSTRALDLASRALTPDEVLHGLRELLHADTAAVENHTPDPADVHALGVPSPSGGVVVARRGWAPFTVTERARAEAFLRVTTAHAAARA